MKIENHILTILQLYEYAMAIGKSLDYRDCCDNFLKLILKRKNLNATWILKMDDGKLHSKFSIPKGKPAENLIDEQAKKLLMQIKSSMLIKQDEQMIQTAPIALKQGNVTIFNLNEQGFLFLYSIKDNIHETDLTQLQPVIDKFINSLKACEAFQQQQKLLVNLELQNQELSDYAHMVSHDLKSPLRSIDTLTAWLNEDYSDKFDGNGKTQLKAIRNSVEKMDTLINGILDYSTIDKNRSEVYKVDLNHVVDNVIKLINVPDQISIQKENLPTVYGDNFRLQQLFQNLLDNAIKYNDKSEGLIHIRCKDMTEFWKFEIEDNGKGIEDAYFQKIFKTFLKLDNNKDSTGIGLSIVKKIVELYEGKVWVTSTLGEGSTFHFTLKK